MPFGFQHRQSNADQLHSSRPTASINAMNRCSHRGSWVSRRIDAHGLIVAHARRGRPHDSVSPGGVKAGQELRWEGMTDSATLDHASQNKTSAYPLRVLTCSIQDGGRRHQDTRIRARAPWWSTAVVVPGLPVGGVPRSTRPPATGRSRHKGPARARHLHQLTRAANVPPRIDRDARGTRTAVPGWSPPSSRGLVLRVGRSCRGVRCRPRPSRGATA